MFRRKSKKYITCTFPVKKKSQEIDKNGEEITKNISNTLQFIESTIFLIIFLKELIELNANMDMMIKNVRHVELNTNIVKMI